MANVKNGIVWTLDTVGLIKDGPIRIRKIVFKPNAAGDAVSFKWYDPSGVIAAGTKTGKVGTITGTNTLTSTGNLPSDIAQYYIFNITASNGAAANIGKHLVATAGSANAVVVTPSDWTNEATITYDWTTYPTYLAAEITTQATNKLEGVLDFTASPLCLPNLIMDVIATSGVAYIYV
jgi:hypothetical protein